MILCDLFLACVGSELQGKVSLKSLEVLYLGFRYLSYQLSKSNRKEIDDFTYSQSSCSLGSSFCAVNQAPQSAGKALVRQERRVNLSSAPKVDCKGEGAHRDHIACGRIDSSRSLVLSPAGEERSREEDIVDFIRASVEVYRGRQRGVS